MFCETNFTFPYAFFSSLLLPQELSLTPRSGQSNYSIPLLYLLPTSKSFILSCLSDLTSTPILCYLSSSLSSSTRQMINIIHLTIKKNLTNEICSLYLFWLYKINLYFHSNQNSQLSTFQKES